MKKLSSNVINRKFVQSYLVFNNVLKTLAHKCYVYIVHGRFFLKHFSWKLKLFFNVNLFKNIQRTLKSNASIMFAKLSKGMFP